MADKKTHITTVKPMPKLDQQKKEINITEKDQQQQVQQ